MFGLSWLVFAEVYVIVLAGEEWRKMTNLDKLPYARLAEQEKQKYGEAMKGYNMVNVPFFVISQL